MVCSWTPWGFTVPPRSLAMMCQCWHLLLTLSHFDHMQRKAFWRQGVLDPSCNRKKLLTLESSRNGDRNMETLGIVNWLGLLWNKEMEQVQPFQININQSNACRKDWYSTFCMMSQGFKRGRNCRTSSPTCPNLKLIH